MFGLIFIFITFIALYVSIRKAGLLPFPTGLILLFGVSQVMFLLVHEGAVNYGMHTLFNFGGLEEYYSVVQALYTSLSVLALVALVGKLKTLGSLNLAERLAQLLKAKDSSRFQANLVMISLCGLHLSLLLLIADWSKLWLHQEYLQSYVDEYWLALLGDDFIETVTRTTPLFAILSTFCVCSLIRTRYGSLRLIAGTLSLVYFLLLFSWHSRSAVFVPVLLAINVIVLRLKGRKIILPGLALVAAISLMGALAQRDTDRHGLSTIPETILSPFSSSDPLGKISDALMDFCQGTVITAESFAFPAAEFPTRYKILTFSPLPSLIDGYSSIRAVSEQDLHAVVPMSGVGELYHFGLAYICFLLLIFTAFIRAHTAIAQKSPVIFIVCNFLIMFSVYMIFSYPVRNALRYFWIGVFLFIAIQFARRRLGRGRAVGQATRPRGNFAKSSWTRP